MLQTKHVLLCPIFKIRPNQIFGLDGQLQALNFAITIAT